MDDKQSMKEEKPSLIQILLNKRRKKKDFVPGVVETRNKRLEDVLKETE